MGPHLKKHHEAIPHVNIEVSIHVSQEGISPNILAVFLKRNWTDDCVVDKIGCGPMVMACDLLSCLLIRQRSRRSRVKL